MENDSRLRLGIALNVADDGRCRSIDTRERQRLHSGRQYLIRSGVPNYLGIGKSFNLAKHRTNKALCFANVLRYTRRESPLGRREKLHSPHSRRRDAMYSRMARSKNRLRLIPSRLHTRSTSIKSAVGSATVMRTNLTRRGGRFMGVRGGLL